MNIRAIVLASILGVAAAFGQGPTTVPPTTVTISVGAAVVEQTMTIALGGPEPIPIVPFPARPPLTASAGTRLKFMITLEHVVSVQWFKDNKPLAATGLTLEIASATPADAGTYFATVRLASGSQTGTASAQLFIAARPGQHLLNVSSRARVGPEQPSFLTGFVVEPGPGATLLLVRAVGPALAAYAVAGPLAAPQLRVLDARGQEIPASTSPFLFPTVAEAARRCGAFALPAGGKDVAQLYYLPAGAFVAQLSSADGGSGSALLEIYEVPL